MNVNVAVTYMDGGRRFFAVGEDRGWRWSPEDGTLVIGGGLNRTMVPLSVIRHVDLEQVEAPDAMIIHFANVEPDPVPLRPTSGRWSSDAKNRYVVRLAGACDDATVMELRDAWRRKLEAEGGQVVGSSIRTFQSWIEEDDDGGLRMVVAANAELASGWGLSDTSELEFWLRFGVEFQDLTEGQIKSRWLHALEKADGVLTSMAFPRLRYETEGNASVVVRGVAKRNGA